MRVHILIKLCANPDIELPYATRPSVLPGSKRCKPTLFVARSEVVERAEARPEPELCKRSAGCPSELGRHHELPSILIIRPPGLTSTWYVTTRRSAAACCLRCHLQRPVASVALADSRLPLPSGDCVADAAFGASAVRSPEQRRQRRTARAVAQQPLRHSRCACRAGQLRRASCSQPCSAAGPHAQTEGASLRRRQLCRPTT